MSIRTKQQGSNTPAHPKNEARSVALNHVVDDLSRASSMLDLILWIENARRTTSTVSAASSGNEAFRETLASYGISHDVAATDDDMHDGFALLITDTWALVKGAHQAVDAARLATTGGAA